ncbi:MAG TPA: YetF domain-containing protein [Thermoanaerobaculia bacterium]|nr:YetF domain-containing protein [Thermoanaerobaculia bacterium]
MESVLRAAAVYLALMVLFRIAGKRTLADITNFDFVLLLIIGEAAQQALLGEDFSVTNAVLVVATLILIDIGLGYVKERSAALDKLLEGVPVVLLENGEPIEQHLKKARVDVSDVLAAARELQGLERLEDIKYAVLERNGNISIVPAEKKS